MTVAIRHGRVGTARSSERVMTLPQRIAYWIITAACAGSAAHFVIYLTAPEHLARNLGPGVTPLDLGLLLLLVWALGHNVLMIGLTWFGTGLLQVRAPERHLALPDPATTRVAFITTFVPGSEPLAMLEQTLRAMTLVDHPHDTWVLDEGDDPAVRRVCRTLGVKYFTRKGRADWNTIGGTFSAKSKGGNHNAWYDAHGVAYDFVAQIDTDFVPRRDYLEKTLVHFADPRIGWVGTPQIYGNDESLIARGAGQQTYGFYGPVMRGLASVESTLMIGANHVVRVAALRANDLYAAHLVEDIATGMSLHTRGWKSVYVPEPLLIGEGPTEWSAFFKQQFRWAKGSIDIGLTRAPRLLCRMPPLRRALYAWLLMFYWNGTAFGAGLLLLALHLVLGWNAADVDPVGFLGAYLPLLALSEAAMLWSQRFNVRPAKEFGPLLACRLMTIAAMPVYLAAWFSAIRSLGQHTEFEVTQKGSGAVPVAPKPRTRGRRTASVFRPHAVLAISVAVLAAAGVVLGHADAVSWFWIVVSLVPCALVLLRPRWEIVRMRAPRIRRRDRRAAQRADAALGAALDELAVRDRLLAAGGHDDGAPDDEFRELRLAMLRSDLWAMIQEAAGSSDDPSERIA